MQWYALFVKTGEEELMRKFLDTLLPDSNIRILIPKRMIMERRQGKLCEKIKTLLPGYVLIKAKMDVGFYYQIKTMPGLINILKNNYDPIRIKENEIAAILALTNNGDVIGFSEIYKEGDVIKVNKGPLKGMEGIIESYDGRKKRLKIRLDFMGQSKRVDLGAEMIVK